MSQGTVPTERIRCVNEADVRPDGRYVLYWVTAFRRLEWNFALQRAVDEANRLGKPLVVLEALRCGYRWASDRLHRFVLDGMAEHHARIAARRGNAPLYLPYLEREPGEGSGLLESLASSAALVVTDDCPAFFLPRMLDRAASRIKTAVEAVDSNGLLPLHETDRVFSRAYDFRRFLQRELAPHLAAMPEASPLERLETAPDDGLRRRLSASLADWPMLDTKALDTLDELLLDLPIDHSVEATGERGGSTSGRRRLERFVEGGLPRYAERRNELTDSVGSGLSPFLHFGHVSSHEIFCRVAESEQWSPFSIADSTSGARSGWWGMSESAESFLDQLVTWRELGFNMAALLPGYDRYETLPEWARRTIDEHREDPRPHLYTLEQFEAAQTHDDLWNAAQRELRREGRMHNYLRMLWGKKIYEWSNTPEEALAVMIELNNRYALDGRDPNSYSGIFWCLGRYDRAWAERPIFGKLRYMSSRNTHRKLRTAAYLERYGPSPS